MHERTRESEARPPEPGRDAQPSSGDTGAADDADDLVDEASEESFPASDPPSTQPLHTGDSRRREQSG